MIIPVILSGGAGTRLWPLSRELYPKQFLALTGQQTLLQQTMTRLEGVTDLGAPVVVCNENHRFLVAEQMRSIDVTPSSIVLEPVGRNTAPAVAVAALLATASGEDPTLLVLPADHAIADSVALCRAVEDGYPLAQDGRLLTFGIVPTAPETGYGYIRAGKKCCASSKVAAQAFDVAEFVEKPDADTARQYLEAGSYYWNSGMFLLRASTYLEELERFHPDMVAACRRSIKQAEKDVDFLRLEPQAFSACPSDSIDYAVMERTDKASVLPLDAGWNDIGSWSALWGVGAKNKDGNVLTGEALLESSQNCYIHAQNRLVAAVGVENHVIVETADAVLVAHRDRVQDVKGIVAQLKQKKRNEALLHCRVHRPWGSYEGIDRGDRYQVKRITVQPGGTLSSQMHHHRAEHWIVVKGTARITCDGEVKILAENQSTYIPLGVTHRLENPGKIPLELIEVQSGSYLGEDDIVRFDDQYGRS